MRRARLIAPFVVAAALLLPAAGAVADPPVISVPGDLTVEATSPAGASVTYTVTATNGGKHAVDLACAPPAGAQGSGGVTATATFPLGVTTVTCTVTALDVVEASASFSVTVHDTTPPSLTLPAPISASTTSNDGTTVDYTASATDVVDGSVTPSCSPASGSVFPVGDTTVSCSATDSAGNSASGSFHVTVDGPPPPPRDVTPPVLSGVPGPLSVEATSAAGAVVSFTAPTATDAVDGPIADVHCAPRSGTTFSLGQTTVTCSAADAAGNTATATFAVSVVDTTPPTLSVPGATSVNASDANGIAGSAAAVAAFLAATAVRDLVDPAPAVTNDAPAQFPVGTTTVTFTARDASGNATRKSATLTVVAPAAPPVPSPSPLPVPPPTPNPTPLPPAPKPVPLDPGGFAARSGRGQIALRWVTPSFSGFDHVELLRAAASAGVQQSMVYRGKGSSFVDKKVKESELYRYQLVAVAADGDRSPGAALTAFAQPLRLLGPLDGARLHAPPKLRWLATHGAAYYNLQLYRNGVKVLSTWPTRSAYALPKSWKYLGRRHRLAAGTYVWYVWPGFGSRAARKYGALLGHSSFNVSP